jgi:hypothetical protein
VIVVAGNHGKELSGDLYVYSKAKGRYPIRLCTEPELVELDEFALAVFPYPRKAELAGSNTEGGLQSAFIEQLATSTGNSRDQISIGCSSGTSAYQAPGSAADSRWPAGVPSIHSIP